MKLQEIASLLDAKDISTDGDIDAIDIDTAYASDLMSDVLAFCKPGTLLLTGLTNIQIIRTAQMMDLPAIIFVRGKTPLEDTIKLAHDNGIPILVTKHSMFKVCGVLYSKGLKPIVIGED